MPPPFLADWFRSTLLERIWHPQFTLPELTRFERVNQSRLIVNLAKTLYRKERGKLPDKLEDLIGEYLDRIPEGYRDPSTPRKSSRASPAAAVPQAPDAASDDPTRAKAGGTHGARVVARNREG